MISSIFLNSKLSSRQVIVILVLYMTEVFHNDDKSVSHFFCMFIPDLVFDSLVNSFIYCLRQLWFIIITHVYYVAFECVFNWFSRRDLTVFYLKNFAVSFFYIYWLTFTSKKGFGELEGKVKSENKNGNKKMNQKDLSFFAESPKKIRMMLLNQNL